MQNDIINKLRNYSNIAILGFAREGVSTYNFIRRYDENLKLTILDEREIDVTGLSATYKKYNGKDSDLEEFDLIIKTPGVPILGLSEEIVSRMTSQMELLLEFDRKNVIGITGTKGKSTTSSLLYSVFKDQIDNVYFVGNIGVPVLDKIEEYNDSIIITEMSSHQLETVKCSPHVGVILNLFSDHLDHAGTLENYHASKMNIVRFQDSDDFAIYDNDNYYLSKQDFSSIKSTKLTVSTNKGTIYLDNDNIYLNDKFLLNKNDIKTNLVGEHNFKNILFVILISMLYKLDLNRVLESIKNFKPLEHRLEYVGRYDDIEFYNDSIATIPDAAIYAIKALKNVNTLIFGGMDRHIDYNEFIDYLNTGVVRNLICMPTTGYIIADKLTNKDINIYKIEDLKEAVKLAKKITEKNKICLLSPAAASYEYYKNFEEKGNAYKDFVKDEEV